MQPPKCIIVSIKGKNILEKKVSKYKILREFFFFFLGDMCAPLTSSRYLSKARQTSKSYYRSSNPFEEH
jgi:hypothetical protein